METDVESSIPKTSGQLLLTMIRPYRSKTVLFFVLTFLAMLATMAAPAIIGVIVTRLGVHPQVDSYIWKLVWAFLALQILNEAFWRLGELLMRSYKPQMIERIRSMLFAGTLKKSHEYYVNSSSGRIAHWINSITDTANEFVDITIWTVWERLLGLVISAAFLLLVHWSLALIFTVWLILLFWFNIQRGKRFAQLIELQSDEASMAAGIVVDSLSNHLSVRVFTARQREIERLVGQQEKIIETWRASWWQNLVTNNVKGVSAALVNALALGLVLVLFAQGEVKLGGIVLFVAYFGEASTGLWQLAWALDAYYRNFGTIQNALDGLAANDERTGRQVPSKQLPANASLTLRNVSFAYPDQSEQLVLDSIQIEIPSGQKIGVVGHSGAGKSTLMGLLLGLYQPTDGVIAINGTDIATKDPSFIRTISSFVPQDTNLFNRTIRENVLFARPKATEAQLRMALKQSESLEFVDKLPQKVDTLIGERGVKLSGGQRQRIAIARAIIRDAPLLLLDEATSALDSVSEQSIQKSLYALMKNRTSIVIAHRLSTLKHLDTIIVLDQGKIVEQGTHEALLKLNGMYADLWRRQKNGFIVE